MILHDTGIYDDDPEIITLSRADFGKIYKPVSFYKQLL